MLKKIDGKWALVSKKTDKPLVYYKGIGKPDDEWVKKHEKRIQFFIAFCNIILYIYKSF